MTRQAAGQFPPPDQLGQGGMRMMPNGMGIMGDPQAAAAAAAAMSGQPGGWGVRVCGGRGCCCCVCMRAVCGGVGRLRRRPRVEPEPFAAPRRRAGSSGQLIIMPQGSAPFQAMNQAQGGGAGGYNQSLMFDGLAPQQQQAAQQPGACVRACMCVCARRAGTPPPPPLQLLPLQQTAPHLALARRLPSCRHLRPHAVAKPDRLLRLELAAHLSTHPCSRGAAQ